MLDAFIIEELRRREREQRDREQPRLDLPLDDRERPQKAPKDEEKDDAQRGIITIDL
jgi:hypothetical protein